MMNRRNLFLGAVGSALLLATTAAKAAPHSELILLPEEKIYFHINLPKKISYKPKAILSARYGVIKPSQDMMDAFYEVHGMTLMDVAAVIKKQHTHYSANITDEYPIREVAVRLQRGEIVLYTDRYRIYNEV